MKNIYPICPECGYNTIVLFTPPKEPIQPGLIHEQEYVDWDKAHLYCCNGEKNCSFNTKLNDLITPMQEPKYSFNANNGFTPHAPWSECIGEGCNHSSHK